MSMATTTTHIDEESLSLVMQDDLGIVYLIETAQQFWSELEDVLKLPSDEPPTLSLLDSTLRRFLALCATYHGTLLFFMGGTEQYLQSPLQLEHACDLILDSELFEFHSERMCEIVVDDTCSTTDPHSQLIFYHVLLCYGRRRPDFFRSHKRWQPLMPLLMDHVLVEMDPDVEDTYLGTAGPSSSVAVAVPVPIEAKLRSLSVRLLYEVCRVQKLSVQDLRIFDDSFIEYLFDLVEQTRYMHDDTFNYSVIKLIVALNEQFMVISLGNDTPHPQSPDKPAAESKNRVLRVLMRRLGSSRTFGENMIFMLNRAKRTAEDLCMQLLILKILYVLFTTKGTSEYFYTNDLCVLVDVFLRELLDLDEDSDSLRHTYLRVLHPLLTKTQLRDTPYKRPQILYTLESLAGHGSASRMHNVSPTTRRLVERCLSGEWCVQLRASTPELARRGSGDSGSSGSGAGTIMSPPGGGAQGMGMSAVAQVERSGSVKKTGLKTSKSVENLRRGDTGKRDPSALNGPPRSPTTDRLRRPSNGSTHSLPRVANAPAPLLLPKSAPTGMVPPRRRSTQDPTGTSSGAAGGGGTHHHGHRDAEHQFHQHHHQLLAPDAPHVHVHSPPTSPVEGQPRRRPPPPAPPKRRKPPAIPVGRTTTNGGATITTIRTSAAGGSPLGKAVKPVGM